MNNARQSGSTLITLLLVALVALLAGYSVYSFFGPKETAPQLSFVREDGGSDAISNGSMRPDFSLPDLDGKAHSISEWDGKVLLVNFWATWCPPCRKEMPAFVELKEKYGDQGFEIVGVAIDNPTAIRKFAGEIGVNYPLLHGQADAMEIVKSYGNGIGALPYSLLLDRDGKVQMTRAGELYKEELEAALLKLL